MGKNWVRNSAENRHRNNKILLFIHASEAAKRPEVLAEEIERFSKFISEVPGGACHRTGEQIASGVLADFDAVVFTGGSGSMNTGRDELAAGRLRYGW